MFAGYIMSKEYEERAFCFGGKKAADTAYTLLESADDVQRTMESRGFALYAGDLPKSVSKPVCVETLTALYEVPNSRFTLGRVCVGGVALVDGNRQYVSDPQFYWLIVEVRRYFQKRDQKSQRKKSKKSPRTKKPDSLDLLIEKLEAIQTSFETIK